MDTSLIYQALEQPSLRKQIPIEELERIQAAYPYFTAAQVLLAKIYQENKDHRYADQLQQAALYAIDRKVLSEYMKESGKEGKRESEETGKRESEKETFQNEKQNENQNELRSERENVEENSGEYVFITDEELSIFEGKGGLAENEEEGIRQAQGPEENEEVGLSTGSRTGQNEEVGKWERGEETLQNEKQNENENELSGENGETEKEQAEVEEKSARVEMSDFDRQLLIEAVHSSIEMEVGEESEEVGKWESEPIRQAQGPVGNEEVGKWESEPVRQAQGPVGNEEVGKWENEKTEEIERIEAKDPSELTFGELMMLKAARMETIQNENEKQNENELRGETIQNEKQNENELRGESEEEDEDIRLSTNEERTEERGKNFDYLYKLHNGGLAPIDAPNEKEKQKSIIDRFIKLEPKITPGKVSEYNTASNLAKESLEEDFSFATETMAKLFIAQGKFDKAKKVYRKLMELHPEKNVYFAAQLKNLNQNKKQ